MAMSSLQLPRTRGCLVCGQDNPIALKLVSFVEVESGVVSARFTPDERYIGFTGVIHGGVLATLLDEVMVWCATWSGKRFCLAAELGVRYRSPGRVEMNMTIESTIQIARSRLITTTGTIIADGVLIAEGTGKYIPLSDVENAAMIATLVDDPQSETAARLLRDVAG